MMDARDVFISGINATVKNHSQMLYVVKWYENFCDDATAEYFNANELDNAIDYAIDVFDNESPVLIMLAMWNNKTRDWDNVIYEW